MKTKQEFISVMVSRKEVAAFVKACRVHNVTYEFERESCCNKEFLWYKAYPKNLLSAYHLGRSYQEKIMSKYLGL